MSVFTNDVTVEPGALPIQIGDNGGSLTVDGSVSVSNFPATQPVSGTVTVTQATGTNLHTVTDTGSTTAVTGNVTVVQPTGTNLHVVVDSGTITTGTGSASTATITRVATSTASTTLLAANPARKKAIIMTETGSQNYVAYGSAATTTNYTYLLGSTTVLEVTGWLGSITLARATGTGTVQVTELV